MTFTRIAAGYEMVAVHLESGMLNTATYVDGFING
jgi:hypothetical protein